MNKPIFFDTSGIYALAIPSETGHDSVVNIYEDQSRIFLLHSLILIEAFSLLTKRHSKALAMDMITSLRGSSRITEVPLTPDLLEAGWHRCLRYADKNWDWIDCVSFELMERRGLREALSLDRHFAQAGFTLLVG